ncbi:MAG TPA: cellulase family glycosylhydrolase [Candidatus Brocadiia bacterium]|nr:cellulase family glycosylhydrolase [Candidatus Brocadiia bacterium]
MRIEAIAVVVAAGSLLLGCACAGDAGSNGALQRAPAEEGAPAEKSVASPAMFPHAGFMGVCHGSVEQLKELNAHWTRFQIRWEQAEKDRRGNYDFAPFVEKVKALRANGIYVLCLLTVEDLIPLYQSGKDNKDVVIEGAARFMEAAAKALKGIDGVIYELSNEPECFPMGGYWNNPVTYTRFARRAAALMKQADPDCLIATAGTAWMDKGFLTRCMEEGILADGDIDAVSFHGYHRHVLLPESGLKEDIQWLRGKIAEHKPQGKNVIVIDTERGYCIVDKFLEKKHKDSWRNIVYTESEQSAYLARHYLTEAAAGIEIAIWYVIGPHDEFGLYSYRSKGMSRSGRVFRNLAALLDRNPMMMETGAVDAKLSLPKDCALPRERAMKLMAESCPVETFRLPGPRGKLVVASWMQVEAFDGRILHWRDRIGDFYYEAWRAVSPEDIVELPADIVISGLKARPASVCRWDLEAAKDEDRRKEVAFDYENGRLTIRKEILKPMPSVYVVE